MTGMHSTAAAVSAAPRPDDLTEEPVDRPDPDRLPGVRVDVVGVSRRAGDQELLHDVSLSIRPGELVAVVGGSGAGKTTLLETMAGVRRPTSGSVIYDGHHGPLDAGAIGFVPQDDIIHRGLPLRRTLRYAARLRLPAGTSGAEADHIVDETLMDLELVDRAGVVVGALSGGQRKRASVAVELLTRPRLLFLDEPTSGLDPATSAEVLSVLRRLAERGVTVVLTTHDPSDIDACDRVVFLARQGRVVFDGTPGEARHFFEVTDLAEAYRLIAREETPGAWAEKFEARLAAPAAAALSAPPSSALSAAPNNPPPAPPSSPPPAPTYTRVGPFRQCVLLARRNAEMLARSRLTLAVLLGSPILVISMMVVLFRPGGFDGSGPGSLGPVQTLFWVAFAGFFFGLTYGLLQIVGEFSVFRRERFAGQNIVAYVASKVAVLLPLLIAVNAAMLAVLRAFDRLPDAAVSTYGVLLAVLVVESLCALTLGLLTSAAVADAAQATLALPMLCFPQVLFAGAVVPIAEMALPGRAISVAMANRWSFEALGRALPASAFDRTASTAAGYSAAFTGSPWTGAVILGSLAIAFAAASVAVLASRTRRG
jgi:ABC-type multidrug transport system ATPase subunit